MSAVIADEPEHDALRLLLLESGRRVLTSELTMIELTSAILAAVRSGRILREQGHLDRCERLLGDDGPVALVSLRPDPVLQTARRMVLAQPLRSLDAIHLAVLVEDVIPIAGDDGVELVTRDHDQAAAARAIGLTVRP